MCVSGFYLVNTHSRVQVRDKDGGSECRIAHSHSIRERLTQTQTGWVSCLFLYCVAIEKSWNRSFCTCFTGNYTTWEKQRLPSLKTSIKCVGPPCVARTASVDLGSHSTGSVLKLYWRDWTPVFQKLLPHLMMEHTHWGHINKSV